MWLCKGCHREVPQTKEHRFEEHIEGKTYSYVLCEYCCPNCFGGVGGTKENPKPPDEKVMSIP